MMGIISAVFLLITTLLPTVISLSCYSCSTFEVDPAVTAFDSQALRSYVADRQTFKLISGSLRTDCEFEEPSKVCSGGSCLASHIRLESIEDDGDRMTLGTISLYECGTDWLENDQKFCRSAETGISDPNLEAECYMSSCRDGDLCNIPNVLLKPLTTYFSSNTERVKPTETSSSNTNGETDSTDIEENSDDNEDIVVESEGDQAEEGNVGDETAQDNEDDQSSATDLNEDETDGDDETELEEQLEVENEESGNNNETVVEETVTSDESGGVDVVVDQDESSVQPTNKTVNSDEQNGNIIEETEGNEINEIEETGNIDPESEAESESQSESEDLGVEEGDSNAEGEMESVDINEDQDDSETDSEEESETEDQEIPDTDNESETEEKSGNETDVEGEDESTKESDSDIENGTNPPDASCMRTISAIGVFFTAVVIQII